MFKDKPWIVLGDFNETLNLEEYSGPTTSTISTGMREFQDVCRHCSLIDMKAHGPHLTWSNKRKDDLIRKKLDRTLVNDVWTTKFPTTYCVFEAGGCSDHLRCRIQIQPAPLKPKRPFKFTNVVAEAPGFLPLMKSFWSNTIPLHNSTSALFRLSKKLKELKPALRQLSKETVGDITKRTREAFDKLCLYQTKAMVNPTPDTLDDEARAHDKWQLLSSIEEKVLSQKEKMHWLNVGDGNNTSFHNSVKIRAVKNSIREIQKEDGSIVTTQEEIKAEAVNYFQGFLAKQVVDHKGMEVDEMKTLLNFQCEEADRELLIHDVPAIEIKLVLFAMANNKSPGPDGFTSNRLKLILPKFISPNQSAFVKDRLLMENVLLASELVKSYHKNSVSARCALKIDISKAFDTVQWPFLLSALTALGFPSEYIVWIEKCISLASFSVQVNGELAGYFNSKRGLRQGCALSPYLFVICMEVLSKMLDKAAAQRKFGYHPYCQDLKLTHLSFADDLLIFSDSRRSSVDGILEIFKSFAEASGLHISMEKSTLYLAGLNDTDKQEILSHYTFSNGDLPVRYLGLPLLTKQMTAQDYGPLIDKSSLWVRWINRYLIRKNSFLSVKDSSSLGSWMWKKILKYRAMAMRFMKVEVNNGASTSFWFDQWSPRGRLIDTTNGRGMINMGIKLNDTVEKTINSHRSRRHREEIFNTIEEEILTLRLRGLNHNEDVCLWKAGDNIYKADFSSKATWNLIRVEQAKVDWYEGIWFPCNTPRYSFMAWIAVQNRLPTGDRILTWNMPTWNSTRLFLLRYVFQATLSTIWKERNGRRHGEISNNPATLIKNVDKAVRNRISSLRSMGIRKHNKAMETWFSFR
ncbi:PREDICTED: uncharacterized protein LOC106309068 [Brassica oleracea var. oleracea]|uniref:uncharacterized protein LOC106309068 n=1 Tax=Brassica oleracea var. oleracea TaxID=109376 RepID=UPI0006A6F845|nr:PREDICTED: uncharacterized protein LOC106309068 [Brassica oleracea var. oleracea]